ncbi:hypothetical protein CD30_13100 [Ureibacillus massiliensis 4400831 = CIP 108448 = CCUG 49529]|uniref:DUF5780 domain-containing protein n=1 Tax=Ureibacillus massiliensis 4400831 = CIP 108448 = CCUG 49529 TaxID=1211035 RepID=A0A0A3J3A6_9BACL|nr:DUF5780 domain-containing protein [Ureibacillus massiliensis]KGR90180.1 hypothetical protein CD30_13100 [Ureibacillus massiliensis 4400831 = CIP 108448 = CCUG 49529]
MICKKCKTENQEDSLFCNKCGASLSDDHAQEKEIKWYNKKKNIVLSATILIIAILILSVVFTFNNPVSAFKSNISNNDYEEANKIYTEKIKGDTEKENSILSYLEDEIANIQKSFIEGAIDYKVATTRLETIKKTNLVSSDISSAIREINNLNDSRIAFSNAEEFLKNNDFVNALKEYKKVIKEDTNYNKSQEQITNNEKKYKEQVLKDADSFAKNQDYEGALKIIKEALIIIPKDAELTAKDTVYQEAYDKKLATERKQKMDELKSKQELEVVGTKVVPDYFEINDQASVIVTNKTQKVIKYFEIGILMYDANGYPLKSGTLAGDDLLFKGKAESVNIQPGETFGNNSAWNLYTDYGTVSEIIACVKKVEYYDGSSWTNEYYDYWEEEYLGNPIK